MNESWRDSHLFKKKYIERNNIYQGKNDESKQKVSFMIQIDRESNFC